MCYEYDHEQHPCTRHGGDEFWLVVYPTWVVTVIRWSFLLLIRKTRYTHTIWWRHEAQHRHFGSTFIFWEFLPKWLISQYSCSARCGIFAFSHLGKINMLVLERQAARRWGLFSACCSCTCALDDCRNYVPPNCTHVASTPLPHCEIVGFWFSFPRGSELGEREFLKFSQILRLLLFLSTNIRLLIFRMVTRWKRRRPGKDTKQLSRDSLNYGCVIDPSLTLTFAFSSGGFPHFRFSRNAVKTATAPRRSTGCILTVTSVTQSSIAIDN